MRNDWPYSGAFVLQLAADTDLGVGRIKGRIEHIASMRAAQIRSLEELAAFLKEALAGTEAPSPDENRER